jgi:hypothetical protein
MFLPCDAVEPRGSRSRDRKSNHPRGPRPVRSTSRANRPALGHQPPHSPLQAQSLLASVTTALAPIRIPTRTWSTTSTSSTFFTHPAHRIRCRKSWMVAIAFPRVAMEILCRSWFRAIVQEGSRVLIHLLRKNSGRFGHVGSRPKWFHCQLRLEPRQRFG